MNFLQNLIYKIKLWFLFVFTIVIISLPCFADSSNRDRFIQTPYKNPKVVFDFYFDHPAKIRSALYWIRSLMNPLMDSPYDYPPEFMNIVVVIHGTEIVTVVKHNYKKYRDIVERIKYYHQLGVKFKVCSLASQDYGYTEHDYFKFIDLVPSAIPEIMHWQIEGYALITPNIMSKKYTIEEIR